MVGVGEHGTLARVVQELGRPDDTLEVLGTSDPPERANASPWESSGVGAPQ